MPLAPALHIDLPDTASRPPPLSPSKGSCLSSMSEDTVAWQMASKKSSSLGPACTSGITHGFTPESEQNQFLVRGVCTTHGWPGTLHCECNSDVEFLDILHKMLQADLATRHPHPHTTRLPYVPMKLLCIAASIDTIDTCMPLRYSTSVIPCGVCHRQRQQHPETRSTWTTTVVSLKKMQRLSTLKHSIPNTNLHTSRPLTTHHLLECTVLP